jgi:hypothetical protein
LTRLDGLPSNLIVALAVGPDGALWVATDKGVSRLREAGGAVSITTFEALDGLALPVRDVAVDTVGTVWLATDGGLFRIVQQGGTVQGLVVDPASHPVVGADVMLRGTPFHAVTDATGHFVLANLPAGSQQLQVDGRLAVGGPFTVGLRTITVPDGGEQTLEAIMLKPIALEGPLALSMISGNEQTGAVGATLAEPLVVRVVQAGETPVPGFPVTFTVTVGQGTLAPIHQPVLTDAQGQAAVTLTLGIQEGVQQVMATAPGLVSVTFTVTGISGVTGRRLVQVSGNNQRGVVGEVLKPLVVRLEDQFGNPVPGEFVTGNVIGGGMVFVDPSASLVSLMDRLQQSQTSGMMARPEMTDSNGEARFFVQVVSMVSSPIVMTAPQVAAPVQFLLNVTRILVGRTPAIVTVADLNHDGIPDLVTANADSGDVSVLLGRGDGTFAAERRFAVGVGASPTSVAVADLNGDGIPDLVTANADSNDVSVLLGRGGGTFAPQQRFAVGRTPQSVIVADLNGDGLPDLVNSNVFSDDVSVLLGRGGGTFAAERRFAVGVGASPTSVAVADLNGDRILDLAITDYFFSAVTVLQGRGDGTFVKLQLSL